MSQYINNLPPTHKNTKFSPKLKKLHSDFTELKVSKTLSYPVLGVRQNSLLEKSQTIKLYIPLSIILVKC